MHRVLVNIYSDDEEDPGDEGWTDVGVSDLETETTSKVIAGVKFMPLTCFLLVLGFLAFRTNRAPERFSKVRQLEQDKIQKYPLWPAARKGNAWCSASEPEQHVESQLKCQSKAHDSGSAAYQYSSESKMCGVCQSDEVTMEGHAEPRRVYGKISTKITVTTQPATTATQHACPRPAETDVSLFCFSVMRPDSYEVDLLNFMVEECAGIFQCNEAQVFSGGASSELGPGPKGPFRTTEIPPFTPKFGEFGVDGVTTHSFLNAATFIHVWDLITEQGRYAKHHWVLKADPDAVVLPDRLRHQFRAFTDPVAYVMNCFKDDWFAFYGALEAFTKGAIDAYKDVKQKCTDSLAWKGWGEDYYMGHCMDDHIHAVQLRDEDELSDAYCVPSECQYNTKAVFHPFKTKEAWVNCWGLAQAPEHPDEAAV